MTSVIDGCLSRTHCCLAASAVFAIAPRMAGRSLSGRIGVETVHLEFVDVGLAESLATLSPAGRSHNAAENIFSSTLLNNDYRYKHKFNKNTIFRQ